MKKYISTRGSHESYDFYEAIIQGMAKDGGLLVPDFQLEQIDLNELLDKNYTDIATTIISSFINDEDKEDIRSLCQKAYSSNLFCDKVVPCKKVGDLYIAELFHGPTAAFKDMALSLLPYFMTYSLKKKNEERQVMILAATSGDTGKAALEGFKDVEGTCIKVFYPIDGVSPIQKQQMITQVGENVEVVGIRGNFDDAQRAVKEAFHSSKLQELCRQHNVFLSSANSINVGRFIPQIVYYFYSYISLVNSGEIKLGEYVNFTIPSGNFGNCLAGYIAKLMGLPVHQFIVASNKNNILTDFFKTGKYDINREFYKTNAPAMDILVSSNLERLIYFMCKDSQVVKEYMNKLSENGVYQIDDHIYEKIKKQFQADWLDEKEVQQYIMECYEQYGYVLDTHTAVGYGVYQKYKKDTQDHTKNILLATASPYKFPQSVYQAITNKTLDDYEAIEELYKTTDVEIPEPLQNIQERQVRHHKVIDQEDIVDFISQKVEKM